MPKEIPEWPSKTYVTLYTALQKDSTKLRLTTLESKAIEQQLPIYIESYFPDVFTDTGSLQGMKDMESRVLAEMADHKHKNTGLSLVWKTEDTAAARESASKLTKLLRDATNDPAAAKIQSSDYFEWFTYETRYRLCLDQRPPPAAAAAARRGTNNRYISI